jgi:hypothetical protein
VNPTIAAALISGVVGVVGVVSTAVTAWVGSRSEFRTQAMLIADERSRRIEDIRRTGCAEFLTAAYAFADQARKLADRMKAHADPEDVKEVHDAYVAAWESLRLVAAPVYIAGPSLLKEAAWSLMNALGELGGTYDEWYHDYERDPSVSARDTEKLHGKVTKVMVEKFIPQAQESGYPEEKPAISTAPTGRLGAARAVAGLWQRRKAVGD